MTTITVPDVGPLDFTASRRRAFDVLTAAAKSDVGLGVAVSNRTDEARRLVYWQSADWLTQMGLADSTWINGTSYLTLTAVGWRVAHHLDKENS